MTGEIDRFQEVFVMFVATVNCTADQMSHVMEGDLALWKSIVGNREV